ATSLLNRLVGDRPVAISSMRVVFWLSHQLRARGVRAAVDVHDLADRRRAPVQESGSIEVRTPLSLHKTQGDASARDFGFPGFAMLPLSPGFVKRRWLRLEWSEESQPSSRIESVPQGSTSMVAVVGLLN